MLRRLLAGWVLGSAVGMAIGAGETAAHGRAVALAACLGAVWGALAGLVAVVAVYALPPAVRPHEIVRKARMAHSADVAAWIGALGVVGIGAGAVMYHLLYFWRTGFHHPGLAALGAAVSVWCLVGIAAVALWWVRTGWMWLARRSWARPLARPAVALVLVLGLAALCWVPPWMRGPEATGLFGFVGWWRKDGLVLRPLWELLAAAAGTLAAWYGFRRADVGRFWWWGALSTVVPAALVGAHLLADRNVGVEALEEQEGLGAAILRLGRRAVDRDRDGFGALFGGGDCRDDDPAIHPGARDIPDNGVDEDCSGADVSVAALRAAAGGDAATTGPDESADAVRAAVPADVSVVLITIDTWRFDAAGFLGYERDVTPRLDALVDSGAVVYERAYGLGSYTGQAVPPMMTGKYASELWRSRAHEVRIAAQERFLAEYVCTRGVSCGAVLSHFLFKKRYGWHQGFRDWVVVDADPPGPGHIDSKYNSHKVADAAVAWLRNPDNTSGRFFFWAHFMDPHKEYLEHPGVPRFGNDRRARYDHEVRFTDRHVGRVLDAVAALPHAERILVLVTADHGEAFFEHGRWAHGKELWDEIIRVPWIVAAPWVQAKRIARPTSLIDLFPTILDLYQVALPSGIHGRSLLPEWVGDRVLPPRPIVADQPANSRYEPRRVFLYGGWKLHHLPAVGRYRLYRMDGPYEQGPSLHETQPEAFARIKTRYELFLATEFHPLEAVDYDVGPLDKMPRPRPQ